MGTGAPKTRSQPPFQGESDVAFSNEPKDLQAGQPIAVIYADAKAGPVLLTAVVQPAAEK